MPLRCDRAAAPPPQPALPERIVAVCTLDERQRVTRAGATGLNASLLAHAFRGQLELAW